MPKKSLNNPNKPAVKTRKLKTKLGDSAVVQFKREPGGKKTTYFDYSDKPQLTKTGAVRKQTKETVIYPLGGNEQGTKARIRKNPDTADQVRSTKNIAADRKKAKQAKNK